MKALVKKEAAPGLWLEDVPEPTPGINDVKIRVKRTAICGTDLHIYKWDEWAQKTIPVPMVVGHEFVGEIVEVGGNVNDFEPGMIVSGEGHIVCGRCRNCMAGRRHLCPHTSGVGVNRPGCFAEYVVIPNANVWHHTNGVDLDVAAIGHVVEQVAEARRAARQFERDVEALGPSELLRHALQTPPPHVDRAGAVPLRRQVDPEPVHFGHDDVAAPWATCGAG